MSENLPNIGNKFKDFTKSDSISGYTKVILNVDENTKIEVGNDNGLTLEADCPWGTQQIALDILTGISGLTYKPFDAKGAIVDPAVELGDKIRMAEDGADYALCEQTIPFTKNGMSDISAPSDEEIDHEIPYVPSTERRYRRELKTLSAELRITAQEISAKVSSESGNPRSFGWSLLSDSWTISANGTVILKATKSGLEVRGKVIATSGEIGGCVIENGRLDVSNAKISNINADNITVGHISADLITDKSIKSSKLGDGAVITRTIGNGAVTGGCIGNGAITTTKLGDGAVTLSKMSSEPKSVISSAAKLFGRGGSGSMPTLFNPIIYSQIRWSSPSVGGGGRSYVLGLADSKPASAKYVVAYQA